MAAQNGKKEPKRGRSEEGREEHDTMIQQEQNELPARQIQPWEAHVYEPPPTSESELVGLGEYLSVIWRWKWLMAAIFSVVFGLGMLYTLTRRPVYESTAKIVVVTTKAESSTRQDTALLSDLQALKSSRTVDTQSEIISSRDLLDEAFGKLDRSTRVTGFGGSAMPEWAYRISPEKDTDIIAVTGRAYTPAAAAVLANTIADTYFKRDLQRNRQATRQAREYAQSEMITAEDRLAKANAELSRYKRSTGLFAPDTQMTKAAEQMAQLSLDLHAAKTEAASNQRETAALQRELAHEKEDVLANTTIERNPQFTAILDRIDSMNSERASLLQEYTPESREVKALDNRLQSEKEKLKQVAETIVGSKVSARNPVRDTLLTRYMASVASAVATRARIASVESELRARQQAVQNLPERERGLAERTQRVALLQRQYDKLSDNYYTLLLNEQAMLPTGLLVSKARVPDRPAYPDRRSNVLFFLLLGGLLALGGAILAQRLDSRLHNLDEIEYASGLSALSAVPNVPKDSPRLPGSLGDGDGPLLESFRILRNNIWFSEIDRQFKIIAITSPGRGEGKSTTTLNLAVAMAMDGKRVLLVDADVRRPSLHRFLAVPRDSGLTTVLTGATEFEDAIVPTSIDKVFCLPAGPKCPNCSEILNSPAGRDLFRRMAERYDVVLVDCPPTVGLSDVQVISTLADAVLLVVSMNRTLKPQMDMTLRTLSKASAPLIGVVLNRVDPRSRGYGYYYDYYASSDGSDG